MNHLNQKDLFWFSVKLNPIRIDPPPVELKDISNLCVMNQYEQERSNLPFGQLKGLVNLSAGKLVSDVCLLRHKISYLPQKIYSILLSKAICDGRILSVIELMKYYPYEEFKIPVPRILKNYFIGDKEFYKDKQNKRYQVVFTVLSTFLNAIVGQKCYSRLKMLDLGSTPVSSEWLIKYLKEFIKMHQEKFMKDSKCWKLNPKDIKSLKEIKKVTRGFESGPKPANPSQDYVLKCAICIELIHHLTEIKECFAKLKSTNLKITFSGVFFLNTFCEQKEVQDFVENVNQDCKMLSIIFSDFHPRRACLMDLIDKFKYLKYLNVSMLSTSQSQALIPEFLVSVSKLTTLKRLVLRDVKLTGHLSLLYCGFSQQNSDSFIVGDCCLAHCGSLRYLDVSSCSLCYKDIKFLEQLSYSKSLKYLDICNNSLPVQSTCQTLLLLCSSLIVLHMSDCFDEYVEYNSEIFPLSTFTQLRALKVGGQKPTLESLKMMYSELEKINLNVLIMGCYEWIGHPLDGLDLLIKAQYGD